MVDRIMSSVISCRRQWLRRQSVLRYCSRCGQSGHQTSGADGWTVRCRCVAKRRTLHLRCLYSLSPHRNCLCLSPDQWTAKLSCHEISCNIQQQRTRKGGCSGPHHWNGAMLSQGRVLLPNPLHPFCPRFGLYLHDEAKMLHSCTSEG